MKNYFKLYIYSLFNEGGLKEYLLVLLEKTGHINQNFLESVEGFFAKIGSLLLIPLFIIFYIPFFLIAFFLRFIQIYFFMKNNRDFIEKHYNKKVKK